jgi:hypothetical protein
LPDFRADVVGWSVPSRPQSNISPRGTRKESLANRLERTQKTRGQQKGWRGRRGKGAWCDNVLLSSVPAMGRSSISGWEISSYQRIGRGRASSRRTRTQVAEPGPRRRVPANAREFRRRMLPGPRQTFHCHSVNGLAIGARFLRVYPRPFVSTVPAEVARFYRRRPTRPPMSKS